MRPQSPHFLLFSEAIGDRKRADRWRFVLQSLGGQQHLAAEDTEPGTCTTRLELLAVVRGLEALDQPSRVTLVTQSRYVARGIRRGLSQWRARRWRWERFGQLVPIRDCDLWQRVDQAMRFHEVDCCGWHAEELSVGHAMDTAIAAMASGAADTSVEPAAVQAPEAPQETKVAACEAVDMASGPALLIVERQQRKGRKTSPPHESSLTFVFEKLRENVLAPLATFCRPPFTRAA